MKRFVIIMAKVPLAGTVKTRLQSFLSPEQCAELACAFLLDTERKAKFICENTILAYSPLAKRSVLESFLQFKHILIEQKGDDLGEKMLHAFEFAFGRDSDAQIVLIGTDSPTFPAQYIEQAFEYLENGNDIVMGKTEDGGFYLIGLKEIIPNLFDGIAWSTSAVYEQMITNTKRLEITDLKSLPIHYDIDTPDDLLYLWKEIEVSREIQVVAPQTYQWLLSNKKTFTANFNLFGSFET